MQALIVSRADVEGGAARAALRLGVALNTHGVDAQLLPAVRKSGLHWVLGKKGFGPMVLATLRNHVDILYGRRQRGVNEDMRSFNLLPSRLNRQINAMGHDVVNLHWIGGEYLSIEAIGRIDRPVVWTAHDMWPFTGAEHYAPDDAAARWRHGYAPASRPATATGPDLDRSVWLRKQKHWTRPQHIICPSNWLAQCARESTLMGDWPVHVIANPMDLDVFRPWPKALAREMLGLPADVPLLAFGAMGGTRDPRKGWDLLSAALDKVAEAGTGAEAVIFGQEAPAKAPDLPLKAHFTGHLHDDITLALLYSAVDVVAVPSRQDNLPQTATEPQACGCPVVGFRIGGLPDAVEDGVTGLLAAPFDTDQLAANIVALLTDSVLHQRHAQAARARALDLWDSAKLVAQYTHVYQLAAGA